MLDADFSNEKQYKEEEKDFIYTVWDTMYDEVFRLRKDIKSRLFLEKKHKEIVFLQKLNVIENICEVIDKLEANKMFLPVDVYDGFLNLFYQKLNNLQKEIKPSLLLSWNENKEKIIGIYNALKDKYNISVKETDVKTEKEIENVFDIVAATEHLIGRSLNINDISVLQWISYEKQASQISKAHGTRQLYKR